MHIYEVSIGISNELAERFESWMDLHMREVLQSGAFRQAQFFLVESNDSKSKQYCCQYLSDSRSKIDHYLVQHSPTLRAKALQEFGTQMHSSRRILNQIKEIGVS